MLMLMFDLLTSMLLLDMYRVMLMLFTDMDYNVMALSAVSVSLCSFLFGSILFFCYSHLITGYLVLLYAASYSYFPFGFCCCGLFAYVDSGIEG